MSRPELWAPSVGELVGTCADAAGALAVVADGGRLVVGHADGRVRCVDLAAGATIWWGAEQHGPVLQVLARTPDGQRLATAAEDRVVRIWDAATGEVIGRQEHAATVFGLRFAPDGQHLATAGADDTVGVTRTATGERVITCEGHDAWVTSVDWSPDGGRLASGSNDATARIWDAGSGAELERRDLADKVLAVAWHPSATWLAVGLDDGAVSLFDVRTPAVEPTRFRADDGSVNDLAWSPDGRLLATAGDHTVAIWDPHAQRPLLRFALAGAYAHRLSWAPRATFIAASLHGDRVQLWDTRAALAAGS